MKIYQKSEGNEIATNTNDGEIWRIENKSTLCVKVLKQENKNLLEKELIIGNILRKNQISVPRYIGIIKVRGKKNNGELGVYWGLVMEFINGETLQYISEKSQKFFSKVNLFSKNKRLYNHAFNLWEKELNRLLLLNSKLNLFEINDLTSFNVLYDYSKDRIFLIDFTLWNLKNKYF